LSSSKIPNIENASRYLNEQDSSKNAIPPSSEGETIRKRTILSWLIDLKLVEEDEQVFYQKFTAETVTATGRITRAGILCDYFQKEVSVLMFEEHALSYLKQPYECIYLLKKGTCLQDLLITTWNEAGERKRQKTLTIRQKENLSNQNDGSCSVCGDGGNLFSCEKCLFTFHARCMNMEVIK
jgi:hypothetical protein